MVRQYEIQLASRSRGFYLITDEVLSAIDELPDTGILHLFLLHTSAGLTINENADPSVRKDFEPFFNRLAPENMDFVTHDMEGPDDMPAHIKSALTGVSLQVPIRNGSLALGNWQGIYLCEFRDRPHRRKLLASVYS